MQKLEDQGYTIPDSVSDIESAARTTANTNSKGQTMINNAVSIRASTPSIVSSSAGYSIKDTVKTALQAGGYIGIDTGSNVYPPRAAVYAPRRDIYVKGNDKIVEFGTGTYIDKNGAEQEIENVFRGVWGKEKMRTDDGKIFRQFITTDGKEYFLNQEDSNLVAWHQSSNFEEDISKYKQAYEEWKSLPAEQRTKVWYDLYEYDNTIPPEVYNEMVMSNFNTEQIQKWFSANTKKIVWKQSK